MLHSAGNCGFLLGSGLRAAPSSYPGLATEERKTAVRGGSLAAFAPRNSEVRIFFIALEHAESQIVIGIMHLEPRQLHNEGMQPEYEKPQFDFLKFHVHAREARGAGVPVKPPAMVQFGNPIPLSLLSQLQAGTGKTVYALLVEEEDKARNERWFPLSRFSHDL